jgi:hypothetical protein
MRYLLAALFLCSFSMPPAFALPILHSSSPKANAAVEVAKHTRPSAHRHSHSHGGIHSLVGSGDY